MDFDLTSNYMPNAQPPLTLAHHELRYGTVARVPRHLVHPVARHVERAIHASHHGRRTCPVKETSFELFSDLGCVAEGNACFFVIAATPLANGRIAAGTTLYSGVTACLLATAPTGFRQILREYLPAVASAPPRLTFSAPDQMSHELPWTYGFLTAAGAPLGQKDQDMLVTVVRVAALKLVELCEQETRRAIHAGQEFSLDFVEYPELRPPERP
jgi:hypothetical protein